MRFLYLRGANKYPQDDHMIKGLGELGYEVVELPSVEMLREEARPEDAVIVGYTFPLLVLRARKALSGQAKKIPVIFNATASQYEANVISRGDVGHFFFKAVKSWIIDFLSFHKATKVLLESDAQIEFVRRRFFVPKRKLIRSFSGLDEREFFYDPSIQKSAAFTAVFRGRFLPESGILTVIEAAKLLEGTGVIVRVIGEGFLYREVNALLAKLQPKNLEMINKRLPYDELRAQMLSAHVSLGQLAKHPRLKRTLPCKLFESLALRLPYLTGRNQAVFEILKENETCLAAEPGNARDLADKILYLRDNPAIRENIAAAGYALYKQSLTSKALAKEMVEACFK